MGQKLGMVADVCNIDTEEAKTEELFEASLGSILEPYLKNKQHGKH